MRNATIAVVCLVGIGQAAFALEGRRADSVLLNGAWQFALGGGNEEAHTPEGRATASWCGAGVSEALDGLPGTMAVACVEGPAVQRGKKILWVREPKHTVVAEVPTVTGDGSLLFSQLDLRRHVLRSSPDYDPVAERILLNVLSR